MKHLFLILSLFVVTIFPQKSSQLAQRIDSLLSQSFFDTCIVAADIFDLSSQKQVYAKNNKLLLHPASNMKIYTSIAALLNLPADFTFKTEFGYNGEIRDSVLAGDLYVIGGGDPDFTSADLDTFILLLKEKGIRKIDGDIIGDVGLMDSIFWGNGWMWDDDPSTDAPYLTPLSIDDNCISVDVYYDKASDSMIIRTIPSSGFVSIVNNAKMDTTMHGRINITRDFLYRTNNIVISGTYDREVRASARLNIYDPGRYFLALLKESLQANGITVAGSILLRDTSNSVAIFYKKVRPLSDVLINLNKVSDNLSAEMTLLNLAASEGGRHLSISQGVKYIYKTIKEAGFEPANYRIVDGSGVSHYNLVSAELTNGLLKYLYNNYPDSYRLFYQTLPVAGIDGTLSSRMKNTKSFNNVRAKTGTLSGVSCLSGYVTDLDNNIYSFSIMMQNYYGQLRTALRYQNELCEIIASNKKK